MRTILLIIAFFGFCTKLFCQTPTDSIELKEVTVKAYFTERPLLRLPSSASVIDFQTLNSQSGQSLVPALNTVAGVRMEERSPGSYRLSIRGSLLRSPFGIRNVKVYIDEFPLTDAGGNTYLNLIDPNLIKRVEIIKGPDGSLFGANSGGVVRIDLIDKPRDSLRIRQGIGFGSFGRFQIHSVSNMFPKKLSIGVAIQHSNGYRQNSGFDRTYLQLSHHLNYSSKGQLRFLFFYSDLRYQTPGGLNLKQFEADPKSARPATQTLPGAFEQKAGVHNSTFYGGISNEYSLAKNLNFVTAIFGSHTDFENPFITNYEVRNENSMGLRSWLQGFYQRSTPLKWRWNLGTEIQKTNSNISNFGNRLGAKDTLQAKSGFDVLNGFGFARANADFLNRFQAEASLSYNFNQYVFQNVKLNSTTEKNVFDPQLMPRIAISYLMTSHLSWRASVSKGYSPPTLAEILSSGNVFNKNLQPENGYNYESGIRFKKGRHYWDISAFYYKLKNAIVRRVDTSGNEFFINAGETLQPGLELQIIIEIIKLRQKGFIRNLQFRNAFTYSPFKFKTYQVGSDDFSGNCLTGVPGNTLVSSLNFSFTQNIFLFVQHNYTSAIPLNDANKEFADEYHLVQAKASWKFSLKKTLIEIYFGADNILNASYSLGNDLNALGGRFYNAAPRRNYYGGLIIPL